MNKIKEMLVEDAKDCVKWWSMRVDAIGVVFASYFLMFPGAAMDVWNTFPSDLKTLIPAQWTQAISVVLLVLSMLVRVMKQKKLESK